MRELHAWFGANSLKMNSGKTDFMIVGSKLNLTKTQNFRLTVENSSFQPSKEVKILGVTVDAVLSWEGHVTQVVRKCNKILFSLYRFRHYFTDDALKILVPGLCVSAHLVLSVRVGWGGQGPDAQNSKNHQFLGQDCSRHKEKRTYHTDSKFSWGGRGSKLWWRAGTSPKCTSCCGRMGHPPMCETSWCPGARCRRGRRAAPVAATCICGAAD